jgi:transketolase
METTRAFTPSAVSLSHAAQDGPTALILSRQNLAQQERTAEQLANVARGGYVREATCSTGW